MRTLLASTLVLFLGAELSAQDPQFVRVRRDDRGQPVGLDTATVRYEKGEGAARITLDAIGAIHIGDKAYYEALNKQFKPYDALCYELVNTEKPEAQAKGGFDMYGFVGSLLQLEGQIAGVDYTAKNFVHADMSMEAIQRKMDERGDDALTIALSSITESMRARNREAKRQREAEKTAPAAEATLDQILAGPVQVKRFMADGFAADMNGAGMGATVDLYIVKDRNEAAMKVVDAQIEKGHKKIGLFYGAAHFPDFHKRLVERGFKPAETTWTQAWDLSQTPSWDFEAILKKILEMQN